MKFDRQLWPATETSWVVSYSNKIIPRWRTAAILKIVISPYLSEELPDFDEILYIAADFELDELPRHRRFWHATHDCVAPYVDIILNRGRF